MSKKKSRSKSIKMNEAADLDDVNMNEVTDSEEEYSETERELLKQVRVRRASENYDSDYEVYGLQDTGHRSPDDEKEEEDETDSMESDIEGLQEDFDLPNEKAWGKKKKAYYSTDYIDPDYASASQKDLAIAEMEEEEARNIQKRLAEQLDDIDFGLEFVQPKKDEDPKISKDTDHIVKTDLSKLSKRQKQAIMQKESPEFMALVNDFKDRMTEARDILAPFLKLIKNGTLPDCPAVSFIKTKYHLSLNYCVNISFYLMLKAKRLPVNSHPVIKRLAQYRQLLNQLESGQGNLINDINEVLIIEKAGGPLYNVCNGNKVIVEETRRIQCLTKEKPKHKKLVAKNIANKHLPDIQSDTEEPMNVDEDEQENVEEDEEVEKSEEVEEVEDKSGVDSTVDTEGKRAITYQMAKNKGLTPHRKKEQRNPRVKHRNKYRKAKIRRKGAVREVRKEIKRYAGEISGIKASVKKSIKLK